MNINIENCLKNELPPNLRWLGDQLIAHIRELRDRSARGEMYAATNEFLDCYRLGDNQCADHWSHTDATPVLVRKLVQVPKTEVGKRRKQKRKKK